MNRQSSPPRPSPPFRMEERVAEGRERRPFLWKELAAISLAIGVALAHAAEPPTPSASASPSVDQFRKLLSLSSQDRAVALGLEPEHRRKVLVRKLVEYDALPPEERELRLRATQLRAYLLPLMTAPPESRQPQLQSIPAEWKPLITRRLQLWDILPPPLQKEVLAYESTIHFFLRLESSPASRASAGSFMTDERRQNMELSLSEFRALSPAERRQAFERFQGFFGLSEPERQRALGTLTSASRTRTEPALTALSQMTPSDREGLFESFQKFALLSPEERSVFLMNAERWGTMEPGERRAWRKLLTSLPPLPPGLETARPPLPGSQPSSAPTPPLQGISVSPK